MLTNDGNAILREIDVSHPAAKSMIELARTQDVHAEIRVTGEVLRIVQRATAVDPGDRYPDAESMQAALDAILAGLEG